MASIDVSHLTFYYDGSYDTIFDDVSLRLDTNWRLGFIGRNGRGKTTFLKLLCHDYEYRGSISAPVKFCYFPYAVDDAAKTVAEVAAALPGAFELWRFLRELSLLALPEDILERTYGTLSHGERTKVLLAAMFAGENNFLLIDEPTNHLDAEGRRLVGQYLSRHRGFILVSHDREFLDGCIDHVLSINRCNIEVQQGNFSVWYENNQRREQFERTADQRLQREIQQLDAAKKKAASRAEKIERTKIGFDPIKTEKSMQRRAQVAEKSRKLMKQSKTLERRLDRATDAKSALLRNVESAETLKILPQTYFAEKLLEMDDVAIAYDRRIICQHLRFDVCRGDRVALQGRNGCGKTSLLKLIMGQGRAAAGSVRLGSGLKISYVPQDTSFLQGDLRAFARERGIDESVFKAMLDKLGFENSQFDRPLPEMSDGQKKKVLLAASITEQAHLYIWDEPLNYIDVISRLQLESSILAWQPTLIFVEHDEAFCRAVATKTIML